MSRETIDELLSTHRESLQRLGHIRERLDREPRSTEDLALRLRECASDLAPLSLVFERTATTLLVLERARQAER